MVIVIYPETLVITAIIVYTHCFCLKNKTTTWPVHTHIKLIYTELSRILSSIEYDGQCYGNILQNIVFSGFFSALSKCSSLIKC